jgi:hypothetical protein
LQHSNDNIQTQPWIGKASTDIIFILLPPFVCLLIIALFPGLFQNSKGMPDASWIILILLIDVAHVYSTLYRTYFDPVAFKKQRTILLSIPFIGFIAGVLLYSVNPLLFWRLLAYVAVFHFVRQQYGFMRVYGRKEKKGKLTSLIDTITIYYATIYPVIYWHLSGPRNFNWFIENDFLYWQSEGLLKIFTTIYFIVIACYVIKEIVTSIRYRFINVPKLLIITGTIVSWYFGIVYFNGDMAFTLLNVVSHGIPYMALIWIYGKKNYTQPGKGSGFLRLIFSRYGVAIFLGLLFLFAFVEEGLWDLGVWQEHKNVFGINDSFSISIPDKALSFIVPLLALPQVTHYILDGFIWKIRKDEFKWNNEVQKHS